MELHNPIASITITGPQGATINASADPTGKKIHIQPLSHVGALFLTTEEAIIVRDLLNAIYNKLDT